jgi:rubredoxin
MKQDCLVCSFIWDEPSPEEWRKEHSYEAYPLSICPNCGAIVYHIGVQHPANKEAIIRVFMEKSNGGR